MIDRDDPNVRDLLQRAADLPPAERGAFLDDACAGDAALRAELDSLLAALDSAAEFLAAPIAASGAEDETSDGTMRGHLLAGTSDAVGTSIGPYRLVRKIGEGGMGIVYLAEQDRPVRRSVALKVIKPGMDSAAVINRFEAERQALAMMDHPNIARVLEAGTTAAGRPYFVMDLVEGVPVTLYCDSKRLTPRERLELFIPICQAIQHAHQKGIIHRDIKPTNVLITLREGKPVPKVIDFGVAKALNQNLTEQTLFTQLGSVVGTLEYMSPEQAGMDSGGIDTRSDVYSLGVLLYELLTGTTPMEGKRLREVGYEQMLRAIREEEPPKPSTRLSASGEALAAQSALRHSDPKKLARLLAGDLDWIVMRCLEKDRVRRYETANGLARDIERYLSDEPVEASPPSTAYRLRKLGWRHRVAITVAASFSLLLVGATAVSSWQAMRASRAEADAITKEHGALVTAAMLRVQQGNACIGFDRFGQARDQLEATREQLERLGGPAWVADLGLWDLARQANPPVVEWPVSAELIAGAEFLPDGNHAAIASGAGVVQLLDLRCGQVIQAHKLNVHLTRLKLSGDGRIAFLSDINGALYEWSIDGSPPRLLRNSLGALLAVDRAGMCTLHACAGGVALYSVVLQKYVLFRCPGLAMDGAFLRDGRFVTCGRDGSRLRVWSPLQPDAALRVIDAGNWLLRLAVSPDSSRVAVADGNILLFCDLSTKSIVTTDRMHTQTISGIAWGAESSKVYTSAWDGSCLEWNADTGKRVAVFRGPSQPLNTLSLSSNGRRLLCGGWNGSVYVWGTESVPAEIPVKLEESFRWTPTAAFACDDELLAIGEATTRVTLYDRRTGLRLADLPASRTSGVIRGAAQTQLVFGRFDGTATVYDLAKGAGVGTLGAKLSDSEIAAGRELQVYCWRADDAPRALLLRKEKDLTAWDLATLRPIRTLDDSDVNWQVALSPDGRQAMAFHLSDSKGIVLYSVDSSVQRSQPSNGGPDGKGSAAFNSDGSLLLTRRDHVEAFAQLWRTSDFTPLRNITDGDSVITSDLFWPDDKHLLSCLTLGDALLRDLETNEVFYTFHGLEPVYAHAGSKYWFTYGLRRTSICDLHWPVRRRAMVQVAREAMARVAAGGPERADDLLTIGQWFALHGSDEWAIDFLRRARASGAPVDPLDVATCHARLGNSAAAAAEYERALTADGISLSRAAYLHYCLNRHKSAARNAR